MKTQKEPWRKKSYQKATLDLKLFVVDQIQNGQISVNFASKKYDVPRTTISYWIKKYSTLVQQNTGMSKNNEIKKLKEKIEELEFQKDFQQDIIALKKKNRLKQSGSMDVLGLVNKPFTKDSKANKNNKLINKK